MTRDGAEAALAAYGRQVYPTWRYGKRPESATLQQSASVYQLNRDSIRMFLPVFAAFGLILLIACANVLPVKWGIRTKCSRFPFRPGVAATLLRILTYIAGRGSIIPESRQ